MKSRRQHERFIKRLETEFSSGEKAYRGISSDLSVNGLFIRTKNPFAEGTVLSIKIHLPEGKESILKGKVMRAIKTPFAVIKNGMGVLLIEKDRRYAEFISECDPSMKACLDEMNSPPPDQQPAGDNQPAQDAPEFIYPVCSVCGAKNKVQTTRVLLGPKCGKCRNPLFTSMA